MKRICLLFVLIISTFAMGIITGQRAEGAVQFGNYRSFKDFVSRFRDSKLSERINEYRTMMDTLKRQGCMKYIKVSCSGNDGFLFDLISEIAKQGDFESLELLQKDLETSWKQEYWRAVAVNDNMDDAKKLLVKWAKENPSVPMLMKYHPNGVNLLIEMAEDKNAEGRNRVDCLDILAHMPDAIKVIDRVKALTSDQSGFFQISEVRWDPGIGIPQQKTVGDVAAITVKEIER
jgi:hypothetical protein